MELRDAMLLIQCPELENGIAVQWMDLGCGNGTFTLALASLLTEGSTIHAIDLNLSSLNAIPDGQGVVRIEKHHGDFMMDPWPESIDGILMANALHFVQEKYSFLGRAFAALPPHGKFLLVEYDMEHGNSWVPYPLDFNSMRKLFLEIGFSKVRKLNERPSAYNRAMMYSACISK